MEASGGSSSGNQTDRANKTLELERKDDRISDLPDALIQLILSFLPSTKQAIQTGILSKRWKNQWTYLRVLIFDCSDVDHGDNYDPIEISCPKLEELCLRVSGYADVTFANLPYETIKSVLSGSSLLCSLELRNFLYDELVIASYSLKKLVLGENDGSSGCSIVISCPNLEELNMYGLDIDYLKLMELPFLVCATLDFKYYPEVYDENTAKQILEQLQQLEHVKELNIGSRFFKTLIDLEVESLSSPLLNCKCLAVDGTNFDEHLRGIVCVIRSVPMLEKLVIKLRLSQCQMTADVPDLNKHWNSDVTGFNCFVPQLKTVEIIGLSDGDSQCRLFLHFVEFLLKNAIALEKMVLVLKDGSTDLVDKVSQKLLSIPKCSRHAIVELLCSN
ncbi:F-box/LRR-repeat protein At3g26922-like isoform X3 [Euphorbia lathyris]|uniref:F-box/LRR-repeat protein At3g26922-like isoform X3 n=1 Tax=Euphorbia lathyris TaxID=212925 RepID=UPI0033139FBD